MNFLLQKGDLCWSEKRAVKNSHSNFKVSSFDELTKECCENNVPVGSVEFCTKILDLTETKKPHHLTYPLSLYSFLKREIRKDFYKNVPNGEFVKPLDEIKLFTGHIKGSEICEVLPAKIADVLVWASNRVDFIAEWRYYILDGSILGFSRYDDSDVEADAPDESFVKQVIAAFIDAPVGYAIDFGKMSNGEIAMVEVNDGWALGYYKWGTITEEDYIRLISARWEQINE